MSRTPPVTRRRWLGIGASVALATVAGCLGTDDDSDDPEDDGTETESGDDGSDDGESNDSDGDDATQTTYLDEPVTDDPVRVGPDGLPGDGWAAADGAAEEGFTLYRRSGSERDATVTNVVYEAPDVETAENDLRSARDDVDAVSGDVVDTSVDGADEGVVVRASDGSYVAFFRIGAHLGLLHFYETDQESGQAVDLTAAERSAYASAAADALAAGLGRD